MRSSAVWFALLAVFGIFTSPGFCEPEGLGKDIHWQVNVRKVSLSSSMEQYFFNIHVDPLPTEVENVQFFIYPMGGDAQWKDQKLVEEEGSFGHKNERLAHL